MKRMTNMTGRIDVGRGLIIACVLAAATTVTAGPEGDCTSPANEDCDGAIIFTLDDLPYELTAPLGCVNDVVDKPYFDVFFRFDCTCSGDYTFDMCDSSGDTYIRIYTGACGWSGGTEFAVGDDECPGSPPNADPSITVALEAGTTYWIELGTWRDQAPWAPPFNSPYTFRVSDCRNCPPADINGDGIIGFPDLLAVLSAWGTCGGCPEDLDGDGIAGFQDLLTVLAFWGPCTGG